MSNEAADSGGQEATREQEDQQERTYLALPSSVEGLLAQRAFPNKASLHDRVEALYLELFETPEFRRLREPVYRAQTIEGSFVDDDARAALMIREKAKQKGDLMVTREKLAVIRHSMTVVERRYNATRKQRLELSEK